MAAIKIDHKSVGKDVENLGLWCIAREITKWCNNFGTPLGSSSYSYLRTQQFHSYIYIQEKWKLCPYKNLHLNISSSIFHNTFWVHLISSWIMFFKGTYKCLPSKLHRVELIQMSISEWMNKQNVGYPYSGIWLGNKKNEVLMRNLKNYVTWRKPITTWHIW